MTWRRAVLAATAAALFLPAAPTAAAAPPVPGAAAVVHQDVHLQPQQYERRTVVGALHIGHRGGIRTLVEPTDWAGLPVWRPIGPVAWSHDGRRLAVVVAYRRVSIATADGAGRREFDTGLSAVRALSWSPDGRRLALVGSLGDGRDDVWVIAADGSNLRRLTSHAGVMGVGWSPRGPVAYARSALAAGQASKRHLDGVWAIHPARRRVAPRRIVRGWGAFLDWSPDGSRLLWEVLSTQRGPRLQVRDRRGRLVRTLRFGDYTATWAGDGRVAYLAPTLLGSWRIVARRIDGSGIAARALPDPGLDSRLYADLALQPTRRRR